MNNTQTQQNNNKNKNLPFKDLPFKDRQFHITKLKLSVIIKIATLSEKKQEINICL